MKSGLSLIVPAVALSLSACSKQAEQPEATATATSTSSAQVTEPVLTPEPTESEAVAEPTPAPSATPTAIDGQIPAAVLGRWGLVPGDCTSKLGDAKGLLVISPKQLKFYEAVARLGTVKELDDSRIRGTFAFSGEGHAWTLDVVLDVQDSGKTLIRRDYGKDAAPGPLKYTRCA